MSTSKDTDLLAPFEIWEVMLDNRTIKFRKPLELTPAKMAHDPDEPGDIEYIEVVCPDRRKSTHPETLSLRRQMSHRQACCKPYLRP